MLRSRSSTGARPRPDRYARTPAVAGGAFDPFSYGSPLVVSWAEDPDWAAPANGADVTTWPNRGSLGSQWDDMVDAPTFDSTGAGGKPAISFDGVDDGLTFSGVLNQAAPYTVVMVASIANDPGIAAAINGAGGLGVLTGFWTAGDGTVVVSGTASDTALHVWEARLIDGTDTNILRLDDVEDATGTGTPDNLTGLTLGDFAAVLYAECKVAFIGIYPAATAPAGLVAGLVTHYTP